MPDFNHSTFDLSQLPNAEDDYFEFKSSQTIDKELGKKIQKAASGFSNSGGGCFVCGVNDNGIPDNGISVKVGRQDRRDWLDVQLNKVVPKPIYEIKRINEIKGEGVIADDFALFLIFIAESFVGPHMAPDKHYYIRAGAHTVKASHFIVEALWAKRHVSKPRLTHLYRVKPGQENTIQLGIVALTDAPAINCKINLSPLSGLLEDLSRLFPLKISVIDRNHPFFFDVALYGGSPKSFGDDVRLEVQYSDLSNELYTYKSEIEISGAVTPVNIGADDSEKILRAIESISKSLAKPETTRESAAKPRLNIGLPPKDALPKIEAQFPELLDEMSSNLKEHPFGREVILIVKRAMYTPDPNNSVLGYGPDYCKIRP